MPKTLGFSDISLMAILVLSKCVSVLLYGLEACPLNASDIRSLDFVINRFFMKLFKTTDPKYI